MFVTNTAAFSPESPTIDPAEARWANEELSALIAKVGSDSPVSLVLRQARLELMSLVPNEPAKVVGPFRIAA
jgi:hypothetical protein